MEKSSKRNVLEIIDKFYKYVGSKDLVFLSDVRRNVVASPSDRHILSLITDIQERPYVYVKKQGRFTQLKLSVHKRDPKKRYVLAPEVINFIVNKHQNLLSQVDKSDAKEYKLRLEEYRLFVDEILKRVIDLRDNAEKPVTE